MPPSDSNELAMDQLSNDIRQLLQEKEALQADVEALRREKAQLSNEVQSLRGASPQQESLAATSTPAPVKRATSLPDLLGDDYNDDDDSSTYDSDDSEGCPHDLSRSERLAGAPQRFLCPLTLQVMKHPMKQKGTKKNYERGAILEWIYFGKATCPLTRQKLHPGDFQENTMLKREIEHWKRMNDVMDNSEQEQDLDTSSGDTSANNAVVIQTLTPDEEKKNQRRIARTVSKGSHNNLIGLRDRILKKRDDRVRRRMSGPLM